MHKVSEKKNKKSQVFFSMFFHCVVGILVSSLLAVIFSLLIFYERVDLLSVRTLSYVSLFFGTAVASILSCVKCGKNLLVAVVQTLVFLAICYLVGVFLNSRLLLSGNPIAVVSACLSGAVLGAIIAAMSKKSRRHK